MNADECPCCGSTDTHEAYRRQVGNVIEQERFCIDCKGCWTLVFTLATRVIDRDRNGNPMPGDVPEEVSP